MESTTNKLAKTGGVNTLDVSQVSAPFREEIRSKVLELWAQKQIKPLLVGLLAHGDASAKKYADWTSRACRADGIEFDLRECHPEELESQLAKANEDAKVHGIMIYYPCFGAQPSFYGGSMDDYLRDSVSVEKDVEGLCSTYRRNLYSNVRYLPWLDNGKPSPVQCLLPCTPLAIVKILEHLKVYDSNKPVGDRLSGTTITVVNRSEIVGRPLAAMLANDGAHVMSVDIDSVYGMQRGKMTKAVDATTTQACVEKSSVVILGVPTKDFKLNCEWLKRSGQERVIVVNVSHFKNIDEAALYEANPNAVYVPLVGQVTVAMLERNLLRLIDSFVGKDIKVVEAGGRITRL
ncbi:hypothetical protein BASA81_012147 [Batrachochytrium salamandrivorans]|nr:hypothetical protein BASA81_012147 [Batrachochytrium salamandrivorans]